jgi:hypothetical protein
MSTAIILGRDFNRYTGDGLPGEPVGAPLPIGDPTSGAFVRTKAQERAYVAAIELSVSDASLVLTKSDNLLGLGSASIARQNLGLGDTASQNANDLPVSAATQTAIAAETATDLFYPEGFIANCERISSDTGMYIDDLGQYVHGGAGTTSFDAYLYLTPTMRAELGASRDIRFVLKLIGGSFGSNPRVNDTADLNAVVDGAYYTITVPSATYDETTERLRVRWTAPQNSIILGPMTLKEGQVLVPANYLAWKATSRERAAVVAKTNGNHCWGLYAAPNGLSGIEDLSGGNSLIGTSSIVNFGRTVNAAGRSRVAASGSSRGLVEQGTYVTAVYELDALTNDAREHGLTFSSGFSGSASASDYIKATSRLGNLIIQQHRVYLDDNQSDGRAVDMTFRLDNRSGGSLVSDADLGEASITLRALMYHDDLIDPAYFLDIDHLEILLEKRLDDGCIVDGSLATSDPDRHIYKTFIEALRRGYGHIGLGNADADASSEYNTPGGFVMDYPVRVFTDGEGRAILGSWDEHTAASFSDNGDGTFSKTLTYGFQLGVAGNVVVERKTAGGAFNFFWNRASAAAVVSEATDLVKFYNTSTKVLTVNDNTAGAVYRTNQNNQDVCVNALCRRGRAPGDPRAILERIDLRYSGGNLIDLSNGGVLEHRSTRIGRAGNNGQQVESGGWWIDLGYDSVGEYVENDVWGANSFITDPCRWSIHSPGARYTGGGDGFATHGNFILVDATGEPWADDIAKMGWVTINNGEYRINAFRCGKTGLGDFGGGSMQFLEGTDMLIEIGTVRGDLVNFVAGANGYVQEFIENPKDGAGTGGSGVTTTNVVVQKHVVLTDAGSGAYTAVTSYKY